MDMCNTRDKCRSRLMASPDTTSPPRGEPSCLVRQAKRWTGITGPAQCMRRTRNELPPRVYPHITVSKFLDRGLPDLRRSPHFIDGAARLRHDLRQLGKLGFSGRRCLAQRQDRGFEVLGSAFVIGEKLERQSRKRFGV